MSDFPPDWLILLPGGLIATAAVVGFIGAMGGDSPDTAWQKACMAISISCGGIAFALMMAGMAYVAITG